MKSPNNFVPVRAVALSTCQLLNSCYSPINHSPPRNAIKRQRASPNLQMHLHHGSDCSCPQVMDSSIIALKMSMKKTSAPKTYCKTHAIDSD